MQLFPESSLNQQKPLSISVKGPDLPSVSDIRELDTLATVPNGRYARFDETDDVFYIVTTNENNYKSLQRFRFYEDPIPKPEDNYATKQEMQELRGGLNDVQLAIQELTNAIKSTNFSKPNKQSNGSGKTNVPNGKEQFKPQPNGSANGNEQSGS